MRNPARLMCGILAAAASACEPAPDAVNPTPAASENGAPPALRETVQAHLAAISARDLDALLATVTIGNALALIFPEGEKVDTRQQYVDFHQKWFADDSWKFQRQIVNLIEAPTLGHALIGDRYDATNADGSPRSSVNWLALTFELQQGQWRLVFDQNTRITARE